MRRRHFIKLGTLGAVLPVVATETDIFGKVAIPDVAVIGATPAGIMAAISAARLGMHVTLTEYHNHIGGLSASGLGKSDIENKDAIAGIFKEFARNVHQFYIDKYGRGSENEIRCKLGYYYEPSVAEKVFNDMIGREKNITLLLNHQIERVITRSNRITEVVFINRKSRKPMAFQASVSVKAQVFVDATYEGDVYALAGAAYRLGRESKTEFGEAHAGRIFFDYNENTFLEGSTGEGDKKLPAYTYRLCLTDNPDNSYILKTPPAGYDRNNYTRYFADLKEGRLAGPKVFKEGHGYYKAHFDTMLRVFSFAEIPNRKYDVNINPRPLGFPFPQENTDYVEAGWDQRQKVFDRHRALAIGLLYFIQNDPEVLPEHRKMAMQYHLPLDEFQDNGHFPWQLYVREARRLKGKYTLTENDVTLTRNQKRTTLFADSVIAGEFPIDSFPASREPSSNKKVLEGYIGMLPISAYQLPYRIMLPEKLEGLIVAVAASTTHVAYSTLRMEPQWMGIGQVAGTAAALAIQANRRVSEIPVNKLQKLLLDQGQILTYFEDLDINDRAFKAAQFWGTKGFFDSYRANLHEPISVDDLNAWLQIYYKVMALPGEPIRYTAQSRTSLTLDEFAVLAATLPDAAAVIKDHSKWVYHAKNEMISRGEVCLALFGLAQKSM